ncbi:MULTISPECIES: peptidoglycan-binding protein [Megasphaera]|uniref:NlpC/P60 family protein n=1 Tax=Megasphaera vaginalis (ex Srinivasan et al. 2021) TaxID=1111454 RepID=U7UHL9_9FIRM|nr:MULTISPECIES: peptidoglycan-binding protein [Megasphaera]ERT58791.1 NlpC/P60 family protein [Megasphaera vaginalis (ex Srinivasan et al. 2021)]
MKWVYNGMILACAVAALAVLPAGATFHPGDRGPQILEIQQALNAAGYAVDADGDYGSGTAGAVRAFQTSHGLDIDGIIGAQTYKAIMGKALPENKCSHFVQKKTDAASAGTGQTIAPMAVTADNEIQVVQQALASHGYSVVIDGVFGSGTEQAIREFQRQRGLDADGIVGKATFYALTGQVLPTGPIRRFGNGGYGGSIAIDGATTAIAQRVLGIANQYIGVPYVFGGTTPAGFDCSGFTRYVYSAVGIDLPREADAQYGVGYTVSAPNLQPGDLVFFSTYLPGVSHSGIYIGNGQFISATNAGVSVDNLNSSYWSSRYVGAKRVVT